VLNVRSTFRVHVIQDALELVGEHGCARRRVAKEDQALLIVIDELPFRTGGIAQGERQRIDSTRSIFKSIHDVPAAATGFLRGGTGFNL